MQMPVTFKQGHGHFSFQGASDGEVGPDAVKFRLPRRMVSWCTNAALP
jgi:hypothetical protein